MQKNDFYVEVVSNLFLSYRLLYLKCNVGHYHNHNNFTASTFQSSYDLWSRKAHKKLPLSQIL